MTSPTGHNAKRRSASLPAFTLVELVLVLAMLTIFASFVAPGLSRFVRGRNLDSEARRMLSLSRAAQSRAISEGQTILLWVDAKTGAYGIENVSALATNRVFTGRGFTLDPGLTVTLGAPQFSVSSLLTSMAPKPAANIPGLRFLADGSVDESSPQFLRLSDRDGFNRWLVETRNRMGYEIRLSYP